MPKKAVTRAVQAPPQSREEREIAALVHTAAPPAAGELKRLHAVVSPLALAAVDRMAFDLKQTGFRVSTSAIVETALLELAAREPGVVAATIRQHIGDHAARRKT